MIEIMIPTYTWEGETWCLKQLESFKNAYEILSICDGGVKNVIFDCEVVEELRETLTKIYNNLPWVDKILVKCKDELVGIYQKK